MDTHGNSERREVGDEEFDYDSDTTQLFPIFTSYSTANIRRRVRSVRPPRHTVVAPPFVYANSCRLRNGQVVRAGDTVELEGHLSSTNTFKIAQLLRIKYILHDLVLNKFTLRGIRLVSTKMARGALPLREDEFCALLDIAEDDLRPTLEQGTEEFPGKDAVGKRDLVFTNDDSQRSPNLVCRYFCVTKYKTSEHRRLQLRPVEGEFSRVFQDQADQGHKVDDEVLFLQWRSPSATRKKGLYTFSDGFCGCGGASLGAFLGGFKLKWAFDWCADAIQTLRNNLDYDDVYHASAFDFISMLNCFSGFDHYHQSDVLHCSTPCQYFSSANTHGGRAPNDETNSAAAFSTAHLILKTRPRVCTSEQTSGLKTHHKEWFHAVINSFTSLGFSLRWKIVDFQDYGLAGPRRRLIIFASCPGERLPEFPPPTHGHAGSGLEPFTTIESCISNLHGNELRNHNPEMEVKRRKSPYSANGQLQHTFTTSCRDNYHPSGTRDFTICEVSVLQTFPQDFSWPIGQRGTSIRKQIGNSVPPFPWSTFMKAVSMNLKRQDDKRGWRG